MVDLCITTDYARDTGDPSPYLERVAAAGFSHIHWCHQWNTDFIYSNPEIVQIGIWLKTFGLRLLDLHGSTGPEKNWASPKDYERLAGVELVRNRIEMTARLGGAVVVMHIPAGAVGTPLKRSLDELEPWARRLGIRLALENGDFPAIRSLFEAYGPDYVGLCYDAGHGNLTPAGLDQLACLKNRLHAVHLHDNDGSGDQHNLPFSGTIDWARLCRILAESAYTNPVSLEVSMRCAGIPDEADFLARAREAGTRLTMMIGPKNEARTFKAGDARKAGQA